MFYKRDCRINNVVITIEGNNAIIECDGNTESTRLGDYLHFDCQLLDKNRNVLARSGQIDDNKVICWSASRTTYCTNIKLDLLFTSISVAAINIGG